MGKGLGLPSDQPLGFPVIYILAASLGKGTTVNVAYDSTKVVSSQITINYLRDPKRNRSNAGRENE